ncbi:MAG: right-handed parallel beta-helix repeat-containing protein, partial [candidate division NC10 bacterium]|nr:right-handed parallel beta-helix repeat-containing protein [candidate division NC10 bacterium]
MSIAELFYAKQRRKPQAPRGWPLRQPRRFRVLLEALEPRLLLSRDPLAWALTGGADGLTPDLERDPDGVTTPPAEIFVSAISGPAGTALGSNVDAEGAAGRPLVLVDPAVADDARLLGEVAVEADVARLDADRDGVEQIAEILAEREGLPAIHILSHGAPGQVTLGGTVLDLTSVERYATTLAAWGDALAEGGDMLLYGCSIGWGTGGEAFLRRVAELTGADVAASRNATGAAEAGGDWILESAVGVIEAAPVLESQAIGSLLGTPDRLEVNDTRETAASVGVGPGVHLAGLTLHEAGDEDWYRFEVVRPDNIDVRIAFVDADGDLGLEVTDAAGTILGASDSGGDTEQVSLADLPAGNYYIHVFGTAGAANAYDLAVGPGAASTTTVYYVNDGSVTNDVYTLAVGSDTNDGLSPLTPKATLQDVLADYTLDANSLVVVDTGTYGGGTVTIGLADEGAAYAGSPNGSSFNYGGTRFEIVDSDENLLHGLSFTGSGGTGVYIHGSGGFYSDNNIVQDNTFTTTSSTGIRIDGGANNSIEGNTVAGSGGIGIDINDVTSATVRGNTVSGHTDGIDGTNATQLTIEANDISALMSSSSRGIDLAAAGAITIRDNLVHGSDTGIYVWSVASADISGNEVYGNNTGIRSYDADTAVYGNEVRNNSYGIYGKGTFGGTSWDAGQWNAIHHNTTGVYAENGYEVRFNRIHENVTGVTGQTTFNVHHNLIYRNTGQGVLLSGDNGVTITNNTIYAPTGDGIRLQDSTQNVTLRNNILWAESGYDISVATNSQNGFDSDYNNLYASDNGKLVWWQKEFTDLYDWQVEADYDNHSIGRTAIDPTRDNPQFVNPAGDDYHLTPFSSTSIDAGDPGTLFSLEPTGGRVNLGAYGGTTQAAAAAAAYLRIDAPEFYTDYEAGIGHVITWHSFDASTPDRKLAGTVDIDLYQEGVGKVADVAIVSAAAEQVAWTPSGLVPLPDTASRYTIRITSLADGSIWAQSREPFAIVPVTGNFYVDDASDANDEYTAGATGSNRNTGKTPGDPKASLLAVLRSYDLGPNPDPMPSDTVYIDTGEYIHVRNVIISGEVTTLGDDEGATFTGPTDPAKIAHIDRANPYSGSTNIDVNQGDYVTLKNLTLSGAYNGLLVRNSSTNFTGQNLIVSDNASHGIYIYADSEFTALDRLTSFNNSGYGIYVATGISSLSNSVAHHNSNTGISLSNQTGVLVQDNQAYANGGGIYVSGRATEVSGNIVTNNTGDGIYLTGQSGLLIDGNTVHDNTGRGIYAAGADITITPHTVYNHGGTGIETSGSNIGITGAVVYGSGGTGISVAGTNAMVTDSVSYNNLRGIYANGGGAGEPEIRVEHNRVYDNTESGIYARENVRVVENTVHGHSGTNDRGMYLEYGATALHNVVFNSYIGIHAGGSWNSAVVIENRVYNASSTGILAYNNSSVIGNVVYSSGIGLFLDNSGYALTGDIINNLVYDSLTAGIVLDTASAGTVVVNNTVYEPTGDAIRLQGGSQNVALWNNILWVDAGYGINVASDSQAGFSSDYNLLYATGTGKIGYWQGVARPTMLAWRSATLTDSNSLNQNPLFIDRDGADDQLGYVEAVQDGRDDDFHLMSIAGRFSGALAPVVDAVSSLPVFLPVTEVTDGVQSPAIDRGAPADPFANEPAPNGGFINLGVYGNTPLASKSPAEYVLVAVPDGGEVWPADQPFTVRWRTHDHNNNLLVNPGNEADLVNGEIPGWTEVQGTTWTQRSASPDPYEGGYYFYAGGDSPAELAQTVDVSAYAAEIAAGNMSFVFSGYVRSANEYSPDSARVIVDYLDASIAVLSSFDTGEIKNKTEWQQVADTRLAPIGTTSVRVRLISGEVSGPNNEGFFDKLSLTPQTTVDIDLIQQGNPAPVLTIADNTADDGAFTWTIPESLTPGTNYVIRATRTDDVALTDQSNGSFEITPPVHIYYVNDSAQDNDEYTIAVGSDAYDGLSPATPKASIQAVLAAYDLDPGDLILVDTGTYTVSSNIAVTAADAGVTIRGPQEAGHAAVLNRGNTSAGNYIFQLNDADGTTLEGLEITGGQWGVYIYGGSSDITIQDSTIRNNAGYGINVSGSAGSVRLDGNTIYGHTSHGIYGTAGTVTVQDNTVYGNSGAGVYLTTP